MVSGAGDAGAEEVGVGEQVGGHEEAVARFLWQYAEGPVSRDPQGEKSRFRRRPGTESCLPEE